MLRGRILAVDYGTRNVGLACSDELAVTVRPLPSLPNRGRRQLVALLKSAVLENGIERVVVGIPWNMDGGSGAAVRTIERFMDELRSQLNLPVHGIDERLSSVEARAVWNAMTPRQQRKYRSTDSLAAALILERYLKE